MSPEIVVAVVSATVGLLAAGLAYFQTVRTARLRASTDLALENLKQQNDRRRRAFELAREEAAPLEAALADAWRDLQLVKDTIATLTTAEQYDLRRALADVSQPAERLVLGYGTWGARLPADARNAWHRARGRVLVFRDILQLQTGASRGDVCLPSKDLEELRETRLMLTESQMTLDNARQHLRQKVLEQVLNLIDPPDARIDAP